MKRFPCRKHVESELQERHLEKQSGDLTSDKKQVVVVFKMKKELNITEDN